MNKPFEHYLTIVEDTLEYKLFDWQKDVLRYIYNGEHYCLYCGRHFGLTMLDQAILILYMAMDKENDNDK